MVISAILRCSTMPYCVANFAMVDVFPAPLGPTNNAIFCSPPVLSRGPAVVMRAKSTVRSKCKDEWRCEEPGSTNVSCNSRRQPSAVACSTPCASKSSYTR